MKINKLLFLLLALSLSACTTNSSSGNNNNNNGNPSSGDDGSGNNNDSGNNNNQGDDSGSGSGSNPSGDNNQGDEEETFIPKRMQDTPILHCFNWSMNTIKNNLQSIKDAGFKTIQLSPMQPQKDYSGNENWKKGWWKLYQPLGFSIATKDNALGTKSELTSLCASAKSMGIDVIVDVVSNHLGGGDRNSLNWNVQGYESTIYSNSLVHNTNKWADDGDLESIVRGNIGDYPDLKTEDDRVQQRVLSLLKEYIDAGVNGFRFDAAKHIETPDDGTYASNYWPTILNGATTYAESKGLDAPYYYGEILNQCGSGRKFSSYTKYMSVIASNQGEALLNSVISKNLSNIATTYDIGVDPTKLVLWAESHDTFSNDKKETTNVSVENIHKAYMIQASRKDASSLYLARPVYVNDDSGDNTKLGNVGRTDYKNSEIKAINQFHTIYAGKDEAISKTDGCFINVRGGKGAAIINISNNSSSVSNLQLSGLKDGTYKNLLTNQNVTVSNSKANITFTNNACILVDESIQPSTQEVTLNLNYKLAYKDTQAVTVTATNAKTITYSINGGTATTLTGTTINLPNSLAKGKVTLKVTATNGSISKSQSVEMIKTDTLTTKTFFILGVDTNYKYALWAWKGNSDGSWLTCELDGNILGATIGDNDKFILVRFAKDKSIDWSNKDKQSEDTDVNGAIYNYSDLIK